VTAIHRRLVVLRHGRTAWNVEGRFQGQMDPPLDAVGCRQATTAADAMAHLHPVSVVTSDLVRARQTAETIGARCRIPVTVDPDLREVALGGWEGLDGDEAARRFPDELVAWLAGEDVRRGGGETLAEAATRAARALVAAIDCAGAGETIVVVSHGLVVQAALARLHDAGVVTLARPAPHLANGEWLVVATSHRRPRPS
jgi:broad specificity phosphatase PhoE